MIEINRSLSYAMHNHQFLSLFPIYVKFNDYCARTDHGYHCRTVNNLSPTISLLK